MTTFSPIQRVATAVFARISTDSTVVSLVGTRVFHEKANADESLPLIVFYLQNVATTKCMGAGSAYSFLVELFFYETKDSDVLHQIANAVNTALSTKMTATGFDRVVLVRETVGLPSYENDSWSMVVRYKGYAYETT